MEKKSRICLFFWILSLMVYVGTPGPASADCPDLDITADNRMISIHVKDAPIHCILNQVSRQAGIAIHLWQDSPRRITLSLTRVPLDDFFKKLGMGNVLVYTRVPGTSEYRVVAVDLADLQSEQVIPSPKPSQTQINPDKSPKENDHSKPGELLIQFNPSVPEDQTATLHQFLGSFVLKTIPRLNLHQIQFDPRISRDTAIRMYLASGLVASAEPHFLRTPQQIIPDDPDFSKQWGLQAIQAPDAWEISQGSEDIIIAVIDTGVDYVHPDLRQNIWINPAEAQGQAGVDDDGNGYVDDTHGWDFADNDNDPLDFSSHGTHVAGIIGAHTHNAMDIAGVCPNVRIMVLKVEPDSGGGMETFAIVEAIDYAARHGVAILNCSFGGKDFQLAERLALINFAESNDGLIICAAGNNSDNGTDNDQVPLYPASYDLPRIISVAASRQDASSSYVLAPFSNFGETSVDLMAPGDNIFSLKPAQSDSTGYMTGTSMSTGFVSGAAGLVWAHAPQITAEQVKAILLNHIDPILPPPGRLLLTNGHLNIFKALTPLPGDVNKNYLLQIPDTVTVLQILSGHTDEHISPDIRHWDSDGDETAGLPEAITVLQNDNRFQ
jgi:subtilisin family serine protease